MEDIGANAAIVVHIAKESQLHLDYCSRWGITKEDVLNSPESVFNSAYTRYVLDKGTSGDMLDLKAAMAPCLIGYGEIGLKLFNDPATKRGKNSRKYELILLNIVNFRWKPLLGLDLSICSR
jgi:hydroxymethylpyrimidine/phosphomethylpyrimidine kinase